MSSEVGSATAASRAEGAPSSRELSRIVYAKIGFEVQGAAFEVYRHLGPGFLATVYVRAMLVELQMRGLRVARQVAVPVRYKDQVIGRHFADLVVEDVAVVELKAQGTLGSESGA